MADQRIWVSEEVAKGVAVGLERNGFIKLAAEVRDAIEEGREGNPRPIVGEKKVAINEYKISHNIPMTMALIQRPHTLDDTCWCNPTPQVVMHHHSTIKDKE